MIDIRIEKITLNVGVGQGGQNLENARSLLEMISEMKPVTTRSKTRNPVFKIRKGDAIGVKVTVRGEKAKEILTKSLKVKENTLSPKVFDKHGNFSFGIKEYIDYPGVKYDPKVGMLGFDVCITLCRKGKRVSQRRVGRAKIGRNHKITKDQAIEFAKKELGIKVENN